MLFEISCSVTQLCSAPCNSRLPCLPLSPRISSDLCPLIWWCSLTISSSATPFSFGLQSFPSLGSFPMSWLFTIGGQSTGASASVLPMNIQDQFPLGWSGLVSLKSKGLSRVFSNTTVQSINSSVLSFLYSPTLTSIPDYWKNYDFTDLCQQNYVSAF